MNDQLSGAFSIRPAEGSDAGAVHGLFEEHLQSLGYEPDPDLDEDMADFARTYSGLGNAFLLATSSGQGTIGMGGVRQGEIRRIYVRPEFRGRGVARALVLGLLRAALAGGARSLRGIISRRNEYMRQVFLSCGCLPTGLTPDHLKMRHCEILSLELPRDLTRPVAVITGGSRGLGRELARHFAPRCNVFFGWWNSADAALDLAREQAALGHWVRPVRCDARDWERMVFLAELVKTAAGPCQYLIHTTGVFSMRSLEEIDPATWRDELDTTVTSGFYAWRAFRSQLRSHRRSRLVFIGDSGAEQLRARPRSTAYYVGKHGLLLLARAIADENQQSGVTCNVVSPGVMPNSVDLGEPGIRANVTFHQVAELIGFVLSPAADAVSGSNLIASAGWNL